MSNMKNGFSTLNRWLGKKNKDKTVTPNGKLSKSSNNLSLSVSNTNINETSQLEYNRITPLPVATSNAPFEQTFRITVLLPKDQLYVARLGARVPLSKLLELVCENKQLDAEKYEFRNPVDPSQTYSCDLTIGAVGLSEVRLCHKTEDYDNFNADEVIKLHRSAIIRDSLSSSEFSSRNSKHTTKTASPYSSSNSLNSMDSTGMNYTRTPVGPPAIPNSTPPKMMMAPPPRKKRAAPRPPSQIVIPEQSALVINGNEALTPRDSEITLRNDDGVLPPSRKDFYLSAPNLASSTMISNSSYTNVDCNGNSKSNQNHNGNNQSDDDDQQQLNNSQVEEKNARNLYSVSVQNLSSVDESQKLPEPSPRKRILQIKKKTAPAPPPRGSMYADDTISISSATTPDAPSTPPPTPATPMSPEMPLAPEAHSTLANLNGNATPEPPKPTARETVVKPISDSNEKPATPPPNIPKPVPRITTTAQINSVPIDDKEKENANITQQNVSKVLLNRTPTPEPRSLSTEPPDETHAILLNGDDRSTHIDDDDNVSKQADSGIGEPVPSPVPDSLPSESSAIDGKSSNFESSSDDDDMVKVYNFKLGKTLVKPIDEHPLKTLDDLTALTAADDTEGEEPNSGTTTVDATPVVTDSTSWNFQIPISPPPNFADERNMANAKQDVVATTVPDMPITPKITERPVLNFAIIAVESNRKSVDAVDRTTKIVAPSPPPPVRPQQLKVVEKTVVTVAAPVASSPGTPLNDIVDELSTIINEKRMDTLIKKADDSSEIKAAKPNTLSNFSITSIAQQQTGRPAEKPRTAKKIEPSQVTKAVEAPKAAQPENNTAPPSSPESVPDEDKLYRKRGSANLLKQQQRRSITRADSFHATLQSQQSTEHTGNTTANDAGLSSRSSSYLSLTKIEQNGFSLNRRRSSSELSIGESPSLQSLEVIKTILNNSRKNSLNNSGSDGESKTASVEILNRVESTAVPIVSKTVVTTATIVPAPIKFGQVEIKPKTISVALEEKSAAPAVEKPVKEIPKVYRYSGPPSINFSTWSERPKVQVAIKNEGDYIFGGKNASSANAAVTTAAVEIRTATNTSSMPRSYRATMATEDFRDFKFRNEKKPIQTEELKVSVAQATESVLASVAQASPSSPPPVAPKPFSTTIRMGIPEKQYKVPITVKPLKDVTVEGIQINEDTIKMQNGVATNTATNISKTVIVNEKVGKSLETPVQTTQAHLRPISQVPTFNTLPRSGNKRFSTPAPGPELLRSTFITKQEVTVKPQQATMENAAPFGQNTLRKTGFKEKMLAKEEAEKQAKQSVAQVTISHDNGTIKSTTINSTQKSTPAAQIQMNSTQQKATSLQSAKLELKLQKSTSVYVNQASSPVTSVVTTPKSAPVAPPPPPIMPTLKPVTNKTQINGTPAATDPRDQLLAAIRNFKRDELNRS